MNVTHAKPANQFSQVQLKGQTVNLGLKLPCQCGSEVKFKACCYAKATKDWAWVLLTADKLELVTASGQFEGLDNFGDPLVFAHPTYKDASEFAANMKIEAQTGKPIIIVRWNLEDLNAVIANTFPPGQRVMVSCGPGVSDMELYCIGEALEPAMADDAAG